MTNRNNTQITCTILQVTNQQIGITELARKTNLHYTRLVRLVDNLTSSGLINTIVQEDRKTYVITEQGRMLLQEYEKFDSLAKSFGMEL